MNFQKAARATSRWLWFSSVWMCLAPGVIEFGVWFVVVWFAWLLRGADATRDTIFGVILMVDAFVASSVTAFRQRRHPIVHPMFGIAAIAGGLISAPFLVSVVWFGLDSQSQNSETLTFGNLLVGLSVIAVTNAAMLGWMVRRMRGRHRAIPALINELTAGGKYVRRMAIVALCEIIHIDNFAARHRGGLVSLRQWIHRTETTFPIDAVLAAIRRARRDDDRFVRAQAINVLKKMSR